MKPSANANGTFSTSRPISVSVPFTSMMVNWPRTTPASPASMPARRRRKSARSAVGTSDSEKRRMRGASIEMNAVSMKSRTTKKIARIVPESSRREKATRSPTRLRSETVRSCSALARPAARSTENRPPVVSRPRGVTSSGIP